MALRSVCGLLSRRVSNPNVRSFHSLGVVQPRQSRDLAGWFSEIFTADPYPPPASISKLMAEIYTHAPNTVRGINLHCRKFLEGGWSINGLQIGTPRARSVVLVSGLQAFERFPIGVCLYVAAALSRNPIEGVEVSVFPVMKPKEYELQWRVEQLNQARQVAPPAFPNGSFTLGPEERESGIAGPLKSYVMKRSSNFVDVVLDLNSAGSMIQLKNNSLANPLRRAESFVSGMPEYSSVRLATTGERTLFGLVNRPPVVVVELRDRHKSLGEERVSSCGEEVLAAIGQLVKDTDGGPRGFVL